MVREEVRRIPITLGHVAVYARDTRWRRALARSLDAAGHSHRAAATAADVRRLLMAQRFDVMALRIRDNTEASEVAQALRGITLPPHGIFVGGPSAQLLSIKPAGRGTLRYVPASMQATEVSRLVDASVSAGTADDGKADHGAAAHIEEVDVEELIESSAAEVYPQARRKQQRFSSVVDGPIALVLANPTRIRRAVVSLLRLSVALAPRGALVRVESHGSHDEWALRIHASASKGSRRGAAQLAEALRDETKTLSAVSREVRPQGGLVWAELLGPDDLALCLTLPVAVMDEQSVPA
jgi:signal transduction histidine kinase